MFRKPGLLSSAFLLSASIAYGQTAYFVDGYHGGKWGHYPPQYTSFLMEQLQRHPDWKLNLEIEPVTWDWAKEVDAEGYKQFAALMADQSAATGRLEYVNPAYGQAYLYNISGESIIRQFAYGMEVLRRHFPNIRFDTYSSEEPCFTSALPQILKAFGFKYASLKNPNTCWGGYVKGYGGEMLDWLGPDGSPIPTVPRYGMENLKPGSTWETIGSYNTKNFVNSALAAGIAHPLGMCLQDAGWKNGPWLGQNGGEYQPTAYTTWRNYFEHVSTKRHLPEWRLSQEDIQVSLVWGAQVLQRIAQQVRKAENKLLMAEKWAVLDRAFNGQAWPAALKDAWYPLLLAQHHDCWIVPYNKVDSLDWAGKVKQWTGFTEQVADSVMAYMPSERRALPSSFRVRNVLPYERNGLVTYTFAESDPDTSLIVVDAQGRAMPTQWNNLPDGQCQLLFKATVPSMGQARYHLEKRKPAKGAFAQLKWRGDELMVQTDHYVMTLNARFGGVITSLRSRTMAGKEFVDTSSYKGFNMLRGFFYDENRFRSSTESPATIQVIEEGPVRLKLQVKGKIAGHPFIQEICLVRGEPRMDFGLTINWQEQPGIGQFDDTQLQLENREKAFYNDRYKLLLLFPANLEQQHIAKNAPFDVTESRLRNTFFSSWDSIKNNVLLDWVDVTDGKRMHGLTLFSDHTTSYAHGEQHPLALNVQYAGKALWGKDYQVDGPTQITYSILPHRHDWAKGQLWWVNDGLTNPLTLFADTDQPAGTDRSLLSFGKPGYQLSAMKYDANDMLLRIFNAAGDEQPITINLGMNVTAAQVEDLNGECQQILEVERYSRGAKLRVQMPRFGFRTLRIRTE